MSHRDAVPSYQTSGGKFRGIESPSGEMLVSMEKTWFKFIGT